MIPIKIAGKKYNIKSIPELSTAEFIELSKIDKLDTLKYIAWQTKLPFKDCFYAIISFAVEKSIGNMPDITKLPKSERFDYRKIIDTVGQRHQIEASNLTGLELLVFVLAVSQARSNNIDDVYKYRYEYMQLPFSEVLPAGFFFFKIFNLGRNLGVMSSARLRVWIWIANLKKVRGLIGLTSIAMNLRYKHFASSLIATLKKY